MYLAQGVKVPPNAKTNSVPVERQSHNVGEVTGHLSSSPVLSWPSLRTKLSGLKCPAEIFSVWHKDCGQLSYDTWKQSLTETVPRTDVNNVSRICKMSTVIMSLAKKNVGDRPSRNIAELVQWERSVCDIAVIGVAAAKEILMQTKPVVNQVCKTDIIKLYASIEKKDE